MRVYYGINKGVYRDSVSKRYASPVASLVNLSAPRRDKIITCARFAELCSPSYSRPESY